MFGAMLALATAAASAEATEVLLPRISTVMCGQVPCGTMEISWYRHIKDEDATPGREHNGDNIRGRFPSFRDQAREFHDLQVLTRFRADDFRWSRDPGVALPLRFVDAPPFGMQHPETDAQGHFLIVEHKFDALPWSDEGDFPLFEDRPRAFLASARRHGAVTMEFETWLVCVISAKEGPDREQVRDDTYEAAALVGWAWEYGITYRDVGAIGVDEFEDYTFSVLPLRYVIRLTESFEAALGATIGTTVIDRSDIRLGDADRCAVRVN